MDLQRSFYLQQQKILIVEADESDTFTPVL